MSGDELCSIGVTFVEDEKYTLSRYDVSEQELFFKAWNETFEDTPLINDEQFKKKSWTDMLSDASKLQLKIIDKLTQEYVGEVVLMKFDTEMLEIGIDLENKTVNIDHQLQRTCDMRYIIEETKTEAGKRKIPITEDVAQMFQAIIEDREPPKLEKVIDGYTGFLFYDDDGNPLVAMHWQHRFNRMVGRYNDIYRVQMPNITPHVCRHTYCSNMAKSGMNPKTLQYLMGHSDIGVTLNTYTHLGLEDAEDELRRLEDLQNARKELERTQGEKTVSQKMFKAI